MASSPRNGPGSNQYQTRPSRGLLPVTDGATRRAVSEAVVDLDIEVTGWAFTSPVDVDLDATRAAQDATEPGVCARYAAHPDRTVRRIVAGNEACPVGVLVVLASDHVPSVQEAALRNPNLPADAVRAWFFHTDSSTGIDIPATAVRHPNCPGDVLDAAIRGDRGAELVWDSMRHPNMPAETVRWVATVAGGERHPAVLANPHCPPEVLLSAVKDPSSDSTVTAAVASNPNCPDETLRLLIDNSPADAEAVAAHPNSSRATLAYLAARSRPGWEDAADVARDRLV